MTIVLDTPEQITGWVLMSRISQCHLHMGGMPVKGLLKWLKANVPDCANARTVKAAYPGLLDYCDTFGVTAPGGERCHYQVLVKVMGLYHDRGVFYNMTDVSFIPGLQGLYDDGRVVILRTMAPVRERDPKIQMVMG